MGEEVKVEHFIMETEDRQGIVWPGITSVTMDISEEPVDVETFNLGSLEGSFTATVKYPKFWRCKNRKRYKKLLMSTGMDRNFIDCYLQDLKSNRKERQSFCYSYQWLWDQLRRAIYGF